MTIWPAQSLQFVWFMASLEGMSADAFFEALTGEEPESTQRNKVPNPANPFLSVAAGVIGGKQYHVQFQPGRIDLLVSAAPPVGPEDADRVPVIETEKEIKAILQGVRSIEFALQPTIRQAVVANLFLAAPDEATASKLFFDKIGYRLEISEVSDALFQLNRRKQMKNSHYSMNRLLRFGVASFQDFVIQFTPGAQAAPVPVSRQRYGVSFVVDINTVPDGLPIEQAAQITIFDELSDELLKIAAIGSPRALVD